MIDPILRDAESKMSKSVDHFGSELVSIRTGRANPALIDKVMVPYYGTLPPLNEERRKEYVKLVRHKAEEARVAIRNVRRDEVHRIDQLQKQGDVPEDEAKRAQARLQKITETQVARVDALATHKEAEVMEV